VNTKAISWQLSLLISLSFCINNALADDGKFRIKVGVGNATYTQPWWTGTDIKSNYTQNLFGVSYLTSNGMFGDLSIKTSGSSAEYNAKELGWAANDLPFDRTETALTLGAVDTGGFGMFLGLMSNKTVIENLNYKHTQTSAGISVGLGQAIPIHSGSGGTISVTGAVGFMAAKWDQKAKTGGTSATWNADSAFGYSIGAGYSYFFTKNVGMSFDWKYQSYKFDYVTFSGDEKVSSLTGAIQAQF